MTTTIYFEKRINDLGEPKKDNAIDLDVGVTSFTGDYHLYIRVNGKGVIMRDEEALELLNAIESACGYMGLLRR